LNFEGRAIDDLFSFAAKSLLAVVAAAAATYNPLVFAASWGKRPVERRNSFSNFTLVCASGHETDRLGLLVSMTT